MQNIFISMSEKFHYDRLKNDRDLGNRKSVNNNNNIRSQWRPVSGSKNPQVAAYDRGDCSCWAAGNWMNQP